MDELEHIKRQEAPFRSFQLKVGDDHNRCPFPDHQDSSPSCSVFKGNENGYIRFKCHGCGKTGTIVDLISELEGISDDEACKRVLEKFGTGGVDDDVPEYEPPDKKEPEPTGWEPPELDHITYDNGTTRPGMGIRDGDHWNTLFFSDAASIDIQACEYEHGKRAFAVVRWNDVSFDDRDDQDKVIRQCFYDGEAWRNKITEDGLIRPLHNYNDIAMAKEAPELFGVDYVFVVEGEKCMHALQDAHDEAHDVPDIIVTSAIGGSNAVDNNDWSVLEGLDVIVLPDHDSPGYTFAHNIGRKLDDVEMIRLYEGRDGNEGDDIADWLQLPGKNVYLLFEMEREDAVQVDLEDSEEEEEDTPEEEEIIQMAKAAGGRYEIRDVLKTLAKYNYDSIMVTETINVLKESTGQTKTSLRDRYKEYANDYDVDYYHMLAKNVHEEMYDGHIVKTNSLFWAWEEKKWRNLHPDEVKFRIQRAHIQAGEKECDSVTAQSKAFKLFGPMVQEPHDFLGLKSTPQSIINANNVEIHIDDTTGEIETQDHTPDNHMTYCLDVNYDPDAEAPEYEEAVRKIFCGNEDMIRHWHEVVGYLIQPKRDLKQFFIFQGSGNNGKSKLIELIGRHICGYENVAWRKIGDLEQRFGKESLIGNILYVDDDVRKNTKLPDGILKKISEEKPITIEKKHEDPIQVVAYAAPVMCTNHTLHTSDLTSAMRSRAHLIPFNAKFVNPSRRDHPTPDPERHIYEADMKLFQRIQENELSGVLNFALEGLQRLRKRGGFDMPEQCRRKKEEWLAKSNSFSFFIHEYLREANSDDDQDFLYRDQIFEAYEMWAEQSNVQYTIEKRNLKSKLNDLGYHEEISEECSNTYGWKLCGYTLVDHAINGT